MNSLARRIRDVAVVVLLLVLPFFVLNANVQNARKLGVVDRLILRVTFYPQYAGTLLGRGLSRLLGSYVYLVDVKKRNDALEHETIALRERVRHLESLEAENRRLSRLLGLKKEQSPEALTAQVIGREPAAEFRVVTLLLDRPSMDVKPGWAVIAEEGVVGTVLRADDERLQVQLAVDPQLAIDVVDERTGARGLVRGTADLERYVCNVEYMRRNDEVAVGDLLVTSGVGKRFRKGIAVARVTKLHDRGFGEFQQVEAEPVVSFSRVEEVLVVPPIEGQHGTEPPAPMPAPTAGRR